MALATPTSTDQVALGRLSQWDGEPFAQELEQTLDRMLADLGQPLAALRPGGRVVLKANFVTDRDREYRLSDEELAATCTHPALIESMARRAWAALDYRGEILLVDSPIEGTDIQATLDRLGVTAALERLRRDGIPIQFRDLRDFTLVRHLWLDNYALGSRSWNIGWLERRSLLGDPEGYARVDLGQQSYFEQDFRGMDRLRFHESTAGSMRAWQTHGRHCYSMSKSVLAADFFINLPKLKSHKKCGVTLALKNLVGLTNCKFWIPHYRKGSPPDGDQFSGPVSWRDRMAIRIRRFPLWGGHSAIFNIVPLSGRRGPLDSGNWHGNDVVWRAVRDLNTILLYADAEGHLSTGQKRGYLAVIDGLVAGEGEGPLRPTPKRAGVLIAGTAPLTVDAVACRLMEVPAGLVKMIDAPVLPEYPLGELNPDEVVIHPADARGWRVPMRLSAGWQR